MPTRAVVRFVSFILSVREWFESDLSRCNTPCPTAFLPLGLLVVLVGRNFEVKRQRISLRLVVLAWIEVLVVEMDLEVAAGNTRTQIADIIRDIWTAVLLDGIDVPEVTGVVAVLVDTEGSSPNNGTTTVVSDRYVELVIEFTGATRVCLGLWVVPFTAIDIRDFSTESTAVY